MARHLMLQDGKLSFQFLLCQSSLFKRIFSDLACWIPDSKQLPECMQYLQAVTGEKVNINVADISTAAYNSLFEHS